MRRNHRGAAEENRPRAVFVGKKVAFVGETGGCRIRLFFFFLIETEFWFLRNDQAITISCEGSTCLTVRLISVANFNLGAYLRGLGLQIKY